MLLVKISDISSILLCVQLHSQKWTNSWGWSSIQHVMLLDSFLAMDRGLKTGAWNILMTQLFDLLPLMVVTQQQVCCLLLNWVTLLNCYETVCSCSIVFVLPASCLFSSVFVIVSFLWSFTIITHYLHQLCICSKMVVYLYQNVDLFVSPWVGFFSKLCTNCWEMRNG